MAGAAAWLVAALWMSWHRVQTEGNKHNRHKTAQHVCPSWNHIFFFFLFFCFVAKAECISIGAVAAILGFWVTRGYKRRFAGQRWRAQYSRARERAVQRVSSWEYCRVAAPLHGSVHSSHIFTTCHPRVAPPQLHCYISSTLWHLKR